MRRVDVRECSDRVVRDYADVADITTDRDQRPSHPTAGGFIL